MRKNTIIGILLAGAAVGSFFILRRFQLKETNREAQMQRETAMASEKLPTDHVSLPSGLTYEVLHHGNGKTTPAPGQRVTVHYTGWLDDGTKKPSKKFDSSLDRKEPFTFIVGKGYVIRGWDEGLLQMKVGDKFRFFIPPHLAYGEQGAPPVIPGNAALIFDVELLNIQ